MDSWIYQQRQEILSRPLDLEILTKSLSTDRAIKRRHYLCGQDKYLTLNSIKFDFEDGQVAVWRGDFTRLEVDCIVNSANEGLLGGGGVDEAIHAAAGPLLQRECAALPLCPTGEAVITKGYLLPSKMVIHAVGPYLDESGAPQLELLTKTYESIFKLMEENQIVSIAFCPISTGFYGHPKDLAAQVAVNATRAWIQSQRAQGKVGFKIVFAALDDVNLRAYRAALGNFEEK